MRNYLFKCFILARVCAIVQTTPRVGHTTAICVFDLFLKLTLIINIRVSAHSFIYILLAIIPNGSA